MFKQLGLAAILATASAAGAAHAATLTPESGNIFVNQGKGFIPVSTPSSFAAGTQIMLQPGGKALIAYGSDCTVRIGSGRIWTISDIAPCKAGKAFVDFTGRMNHGANDDKDDSDDKAAGWTATHVVAGALAAGGIAAGIYVLTRDDKPTSP